MEEGEFEEANGKREQREGEQGVGRGVAGLVLGHAALRRSVLNTQTVSGGIHCLTGSQGGLKVPKPGQIGPFCSPPPTLLLLFMAPITPSVCLAVGLSVCISLCLYFSVSVFLGLSACTSVLSSRQPVFLSA